MWYRVTIEVFHTDDAQALADLHDGAVIIDNKETNRLFVRWLTQEKPEPRVNCYITEIKD